MQIRQLRKKEKDAFIELLIKSFPSIKASLEEKDLVVKEIKDDRFILYGIENIGTFFLFENLLVPTLFESINKKFLDALPSVIVDMGAVPHISNGADIMRPGIVAIDGRFKKGDLVLVRDERFKKPLAIGIAIENSEDLVKMEKGKVVKNIHHVDDKIWRLCMKILG